MLTCMILYRVSHEDLLFSLSPEIMKIIKCFFFLGSQDQRLQVFYIFTKFHVLANNLKKYFLLYSFVTYEDSQFLDL